MTPYIAMFIRWLYLLGYGMWRGECAYTVYNPDPSKPRYFMIATCTGSLGSEFCRNFKPTSRFKLERVFWETTGRLNT